MTLPDSRTLPGFRVGNEFDPDKYTLERHVGGGFEGEVWYATTARRDGNKHEWAVKVLRAQHLLADHEESAAAALQRWHHRAQEAKIEADQLQRTVRGVVGAANVFLGPEPHLPGEAGKVRTLYVVSPWIDGENLSGWLRGRPSFDQICDAAAGLAEIIDAIGSQRLPVNHRDISPANVMVEPNGTVSLIDFTFAVPTRSGPVTKITNGGYTAPEARSGRGSAAADRYSFGAVIHYLFTGMEPTETDAALHGRESLVRANVPVAVAEHVAALLAADPDRRAPSLVRWVEQLRAMGAIETADLRYGDLDMAIDGTSTAIVTAVGTTVLSRARLGIGATWSLAKDADAPDAPVSVRLTTDGTGTVVHFVVDKADRLWVGRASEWTDVGGAALAGGIAAVRLPHGAAAAFTVDPVQERLTTVEVGLDGRTRRSTGGPYVRRVLAATNDHDGRPAVVAISPDGDLVDVGADSVLRLGASDVLAAALCLNTWGELQCFCVGSGEKRVTVFDQLSGVWTPAAGIEAPGRVSDLACVGHRDGITIAIAGQDGLWTATQTDTHLSAWQRLSSQPSYRVVLRVGVAWRLRLAAVVDGRVAFATEDFTGHWSAGIKTI